MKKIFIAVALLAGIFTTANAENDYTPEKGDVSLEVYFNPFNGEDNKSFTMPELSTRLFLSSKSAITLNLGLNGVNDKDVPNTDEEDSYTKGYYGTFTIDLGYQYHFYQNKRIDLYAGAKVGVVHNFAGETEKYDEKNSTWSNSYKNHGTGTGFRAYAITGIDFYIYKGLYTGCEINLGFEDVLVSKSITKRTSNGNETETKSKNGGHNFSGGFGVTPQIRLGWRF